MSAMKNKSLIIYFGLALSLAGLTSCNNSNEGCDHTFEYFVTVEPTCTTEGEAKIVCTKCNEVLSTSSIPFSHQYEPTGNHTEPTCTTGYGDEYKCAKCGDIYTKYDSSALGHEFTINETIEPTCTKDGGTWLKCARGGCNAKIQTARLDAHGHKKDVFIKNVAPTCTEEGYDLYTCAYEDCGEDVKFNKVPALGHKFVTTSVVVATCQHGGYVEQECIRCETKQIIDQTPKSDHHEHFSRHIDSTCCEDGYDIYEYADCLRERTDNFDKEHPAHVIEEENRLVYPTCNQKGQTIGLKCDEIKIELLASNELDYACCVDINNDEVCDTCGNPMDGRTKAIRTVSDFLDIPNDLTAKYYLTNDLDFIDVDLENYSIGTEEKPFAGKIYGFGHSLKHIVANKKALFSYNSGTICDLVVENSLLNMKYSVDLVHEVFDTDMPPVRGSILVHSNSGILSNITFKDNRINVTDKIVVKENSASDVGSIITGARSTFNSIFNSGGLVYSNEKDGNIVNCSVLEQTEVYYDYKLEYEHGYEMIPTAHKFNSNEYMTSGLLCAVNYGKITQTYVASNNIRINAECYNALDRAIAVLNCYSTIGSAIGVNNGKIITSLFNTSKLEENVLISDHYTSIIPGEEHNNGNLTTMTTNTESQSGYLTTIGKIGKDSQII